ncbi:hypothetical protein G6011_00053 [Alternaria panax]|uniref:Uncharacterized protein n=1 Tax=Alternaria panax TaxID=48097 RepID=A0AAD4NUM9_9PLEO|nr:hypothetical protein G6011_00053 [Alternaria panax]
MPIPTTIYALLFTSIPLYYLPTNLLTCVGYIIEASLFYDYFLGGRPEGTRLHISPEAIAVGVTVWYLAFYRKNETVQKNGDNEQEEVDEVEVADEVDGVGEAEVENAGHAVIDGMAGNGVAEDNDSRDDDEMVDVANDAVWLGYFYRDSDDDPTDNESEASYI